MKILYVTDSHIRGTSPVSRLDDFPATLLAKLREVVHLARLHGVAAILHGGDLFDRPDAVPAVALPFQQVLSETSCPIYGIAGNHDIFGFNPGTIPRSMLGLFDGFKLFRLLHPGDVAWIEADGLRVQVTGQEFHAELDRRDPKLDYCVAPEGTEGAIHVRYAGADFAIHLTHGMLLEHPFIDGIAHSVLSDVMDRTVADVTFGGHYHPGWPVTSDGNGRLWINPGAVARLGNTAADYTRPIQVVLLTLEAGQPVQYELIPLQAARPGEEVLDRSKAQEQLARERAIANFVAGVSLDRYEVLEVSTILERIAAEEGVPASVREEALRRIGEAQEALKQGGEEDAA